MINFRYHVVSLVAVFLALAIGVVLGAGPLGGPIENSLADQVSALRAEKDELRAELDAAARRGDYTSETFAALETRALGDLLTERSVALISIGTEVEAREEAIIAALGVAGAGLSGRIHLEDRWATASAQAVTNCATTLRALLSPEALGAASDREVLGIGLAFALAGGEVQPPTTGEETAVGTGGSGHQQPPPVVRDAEQAAALWTALETADLVSGNIEKAADAVVVLAGPYPPEPHRVDKNAADGSRHETLPAAIHAISRIGLPVVVSGPDQVKNDLVRRIIDANVTGGVLSTVVSPVTTAEAITVAWAAAAGINGVSGNYGMGGDFAKLPPYRPAPVEPEPDPGTGTGDPPDGSVDPSSGPDASANPET
ncbi:MAG: copper transporter [Bifidobacteriaceae bacterium]|jgi:hypothetical protein|nr:copper transporter [Bifidobacteriaceae bacterium]